MTSPYVCPGCGKTDFSGTLLDQFPTPPDPNTSLYRLYLFFTAMSDEVANEDVEKILFETKEPLNQETWTAFAGRYRCLVCKENLEGLNE